MVLTYGGSSVRSEEINKKNWKQVPLPIMYNPGNEKEERTENREQKGWWQRQREKTWSQIRSDILDHFDKNKYRYGAVVTAGGLLWFLKNKYGPSVVEEMKKRGYTWEKLKNRFGSKKKRPSVMRSEEIIHGEHSMPKNEQWGGQEYGDIDADLMTPDQEADYVSRQKEAEKILKKYLDFNYTKKSEGEEGRKQENSQKNSFMYGVDSVPWEKIEEEENAWLLDQFKNRLSLNDEEQERFNRYLTARSMAGARPLRGSLVHGVDSVPWEKIEQKENKDWLLDQFKNYKKELSDTQKVNFKRYLAHRSMKNSEPLRKAFIYGVESVPWDEMSGAENGKDDGVVENEQAENRFD